MPALHGPTAPRHQRCSQYTYIDNMNRMSICYGFKLFWPGAREKVEAVGGNYTRLTDLMARGSLSLEQCRMLLDMEVQDSTANATALFGPKCPCVSAALVDLVYSLGDSALLSMGNFVHLVKADRWMDAGNSLVGSSWCRMNNQRCNHDVDLVWYGCKAAAPSLRAASEPDRAPVLGAMPAPLPALYVPPAVPTPTAMSIGSVAGALDDCRRLSNGGAQFLWFVRGGLEKRVRDSG